MWPLNGKEIFECIYDIPCSHKHLYNVQIEGVLTDSRLVAREKKASSPDHNPTVKKIPMLFVAIQGEKFDGHAYLKECFVNGIALALVNRNSPYLNELDNDARSRCFQVDDVVESLRKFAHAFRKKFSFPVIGIGGSNGKTTTKEILASCLSFDKRTITKTQKSENGFLGIPMTILQKAHTTLKPPSALVLEIGIDEIGAMEKHVQVSKPDVVLLTALGPEHLTGLKDWETAAREELMLFTTPNCKRIWQLCDIKISDHFSKITKNGTHLDAMLNDTFVVKQDDTEHNTLLEDSRTILWSVNGMNPTQISIKIENGHKILFDDKIPFSGVHNAENFALAFATAWTLGCQPQQIIEGFAHFVPPPQRSKLSYFSDDTILLDDTYNASPASLEAALNLLKIPEWHNKKKILVLGDMLELGEESKFWHENLVNQLSQFENTHLCLFGPAMYNCYKRLKELGDPWFQERRLIVEWLDADNEPSQFLENLSSVLKGAVILVKGSRGLRLERFVLCVENLFSSNRDG